MPLSTRAAALLLSLALLLGACASPSAPKDSGFPEPPSAPSPSPEAASPTGVRIPYDPADTLNPLTCSSVQNYYAAGLLYDTLVALDMVGAPQNRLAQEVTFQGSACIVRIRTDARFSDGSQVTAQDVAYSAAVARSCPRFSAQLAGMLEVQTPDRYTAVFALSAPDRYFDRSLTFPILKEGTAGELQTAGEDEENPQTVVAHREDGALPVGGGRYLLDASGTRLTRNPQYHTPVENIASVYLVDAGSILEQGKALTTGELDLMYTDLRATADLSLGTARRQVMLSNLVFLGVNTQRLGIPEELRSAFSGLLDRDAIARRAYRGFAAAADSLVKQSYSSTPGGEESPPPDALEELLSSLGYGERDDEGWRTYRGRAYALRLLVNSGNPDREAAAAIVRDAFQEAGFRLTLEAVPFEEYTLRIAEGNYDLYLGELRISNNLDFSRLIAPDPALGPGCVRDEELLEVYRQAKAGEAELSALDTALRRAVPVIPLVYRRGIVAISPDFSANIVATEQDIFYNIGEW